MQVNVQYTPTKVGDEHWVLGIDSNDGRYPTLVLPLSGTTNHPCLLSIPSIVDFGRSSVNCTAQTKTLTIYHSGAEHCPTSIDIDAINMNPQTTQAFTITKTPKLPLTVTATKHAQIQVSFRATQAIHQHATIELKTDVKAQPTVSIPIQGKGHAKNEEKEIFQQRKRPTVDYLFVVADTKSMSFVQQQLTQHIPLFLRSLTQQNVDYRVGVISTDSTTCKDGPPCTEGRAPGCLHGTKSTFITSSPPNAAQLLKQNLLVGNTGSTEPQGLEATYRALTPPTLNDLQCNNGFIRTDAALSIIYTSNTDDVSAKSQSFFEDFFSKQNKQVIVSAIGPSIVSGGACLGSCRYHELANKTNGYYQGIRSTDWGNMMVQLAKTGIELRSQFALSQRPALQTLQVRVNGIVIPRSEQYGWEYDTLTNKIVFSNRAIPSPGATIEIQYKSLCKP